MKTILHLKSGAVLRSSLLIAVVLICFSALSARAQSVTQDHIKYNVTNATKTAVAAGTDGSYLKALVIADSVRYNNQNYAVIAINANAFQGNRNISSLSISPNVKKIGQNAFKSCEGLQEIIIPEGVEEIGNYAFQDCGLRYVDLPSTLRTIGNSVFKTNAMPEIDTLVIRTAYYDEAGKMNILPFKSNCFNTALKKNCTLMVPKKAYEYYAFRTVNNVADASLNWGSFFTKISAFGTAPSGCSVAPKDGLKDYRDLSQVDVTFTFDDEKLVDVLSFGEDDHIEATLVLPNGKRLSAGTVELKGNTISIDFAEVLKKNRELFIATSEAETAIDVQLILDGQVQLEECPFMLASFFVHHPISWRVPLLPSVYDLPEAPAAAPEGDATDDLYDYTALETITLTFDGYTALSLDSNTGAYLNARLLKDDGTVLASSLSASVTGENTLAITFTIPVDELRVRRTSGVKSFDFILEAEGQVNMKEGNEEKNFRFTLPFNSTAAPLLWKVRAVYIPEPTGVSFSPAEETVTLEDLTDVAVTFEGVQDVRLSTSADALPLKANLYMDGFPVATITATKVRVEDNTIHLLFPPVSERLITLITTDLGFSYDFSVSLVADLMTDGYPYRVVVGNEKVPEEGVDGELTVGTHYTRQWAAPQWTVLANICDVPEVTVNVPGASDGEVTEYPQLKVVELNAENYSTVKLAPAGTGAYATPAASGRLVRDGSPVCVVNAVTTEGNKIIIDFGEKLNYNVVGITPDDDPEKLVDLSFYFEGDLLFDSLPYHLVYNGSEEGQKWSLQPIVVYKLPTPSIEHDYNRIYFTCGTEGVEFHYTIINDDARKATQQEAVKGNGGSSLQLPLTRRYIISVYATREGYEDSDPVSVTLDLTGYPEIQYVE